MTLNYAEAIYALDDSDLDVYQSRVWLRVLRRGVCFESQRSMAKGMKISLGKVNEALQWLLENGWIVRDVDERTQKVGYVAVIPDEQMQQNLLPDVNDVLPDERDVLPDERHLKAKEIKEEININTPRERDGIPADAPPMHSGMIYEHPAVARTLEYQHQIDEMAAALSTVTGIDLSLNKERLEAEAIALLANNYTPEQITAAFYGPKSFWRLMCYGGQKGDTPKFGNIRNEIALAIKWDGKVPTGKKSRPAARPQPAPAHERIGGAW